MSRDRGDHWRFDGIDVWRRDYRPGTRGEPQARQVLAQALGVADPQALPIRREARGRPWLDAPLAHLDTGWSHSGDQLLVALGDARRVGVDLERLRPRPRALLLAERFYHPQELRWLLGLPPEQQEAAFVRLWCAKEAVLKAHGHGLSFGLERFWVGEQDGQLRVLESHRDLGPAEQWRLREWQPLPGYRAALAWHPRMP
ncbi:4'-phosphopantetheinyl transferase family protein [Pseudoxanthomonas mexicana]|uniref:4'-phosphopantetheinyl transferase family protein n=1 Tax=Pseudoxanthomonas mexicana TaxID=128785 RepID=UPI00398B1DF9